MLQAWGAHSPAAAIAWIETQPEKRKEGSAFWIACGICAFDPQTAWSLVNRYISENRENVVPHFIYSVADRWGVPAAEEFYTLAHRDPRVSSKALNEAFRLLAEAREVMLFQGTPEDATAALEWLDRHLRTDLRPGSYVFPLTAGISPEETLAWLDARHDRMSAEFMDDAYADVARAWRSKSPNAFQAWLQANPQHPQHLTMSAATKPASLAEKEKIVAATQQQFDEIATLQPVQLDEVFSILGIPSEDRSLEPLRDYEDLQSRARKLRAEGTIRAKEQLAELQKELVQKQQVLKEQYDSILRGHRTKLMIEQTQLQTMRERETALRFSK
jgi:hypothetical protein